MIMATMENLEEERENSLAFSITEPSSQKHLILRILYLQ